MKWSTVRRYYGIFAVSYQDVLQERLVEFVWFLLSVINMMCILLFWVAGFANGSANSSATLPQIEFYYFASLFAGQALMSHVEEAVARYDIKEGYLTKYLLHPISYFWFRFWLEIPWRVGGITMSVLGAIVVALLFPLHIVFTMPPLLSLAALLFLIPGALLLAFTYKMVISLSTFWITEGWALFEVLEIIVIVMAGYLMPLTFFPAWLQHLAFALPFAYMIYVPVAGVMGMLTTVQLWECVAMQFLWLGILQLIYKFAWHRGLSLFTGVGQ